MNVLISRPERHFQLWGYTVSIGRLLLRSNKGDEFNTRVDIFFQNVVAINLPAALNGVVVRMASGDSEEMISKLTGLTPDRLTVFYEVESESRWGFVVASVAVEDEDHGGFDEPSKYWPWTGPFPTKSHSLQPER